MLTQVFCLKFMASKIPSYIYKYISIYLHIISEIIIIICHPSGTQSENQRRWKRNKYLDLASELRKLWNRRVTVIPIVIDTLGTVPKGLERELEELKIGRWFEIIQTTALIKMARILRRVLETWENLLSLRLLWKTTN